MCAGALLWRICGDWRYEGVIYRKGQDPLNGAPWDGIIPEFEGEKGTPDNPHLLFAPDVAQGPDGRYYLYYALDFVNLVSVAVCDTPAGKYEFHGFVTREDGSVPQTGRWFDPAILCEESGNYLYYGFCPQFRFPGMEEMEIPGAMMVKLADDMRTIITEPVCVAKGCDTAAGTDYEEHPFFEASSIRHFGEWYYFVYSSLQGHELCYGMARTPEGPFAYQGVIISNGDIGYQGNTLPVTYTGNNHGGLVKVGEEYYILLAPAYPRHPVFQAGMRGPGSDSRGRQDSPGSGYELRAERRTAPGRGTVGHLYCLPSDGERPHEGGTGSPVRTGRGTSPASAGDALHHGGRKGGRRKGAVPVYREYAYRSRRGL